MSGLALVVLGVPVAGAIGALIRNEVTARAAVRWASGRAIGTAVVNLVGTLVLALLVGLAADGRVSAETLLVGGVGFGGSLTTFSTWLVEAVRAGLDGDRRPAVIVGVEILGQLAVGAGIAFAILQTV